MSTEKIDQWKAEISQKEEEKGTIKSSFNEKEQQAVADTSAALNEINEKDGAAVKEV